jgi:uncharacterized membrane protein YdfJ with MMPL/SSD domain
MHTDRNLNISGIRALSRLRPLALAALTGVVMFGFAALMLSEFGMISNFGAVTVISVGFALIGAIIAMPAILVLIGKFEERAGRRQAGKVAGF